MRSRRAPWCRRDLLTEQSDVQNSTVARLPFIWLVRSSANSALLRVSRIPRDWNDQVVPRTHRESSGADDVARIVQRSSVGRVAWNSHASVAILSGGDVY